MASKEEERKKLIEVILKMQESTDTYKTNCLQLRDKIEEQHSNN